MTTIENKYSSDYKPTEELGMYGLPTKVLFCKTCTISNQRPSSAVEFKQKFGDKKDFIGFNDDGTCDACKYAKYKPTINWESREKELQELCNKFRKEDGQFDCVVPGSGGKDSVVAAHILKYKYNMHPILVTWPPNLYTIPGKRNFDAWLNGGFANYTYYPNQKVHRLLTKLAFLNLTHPFQPFILGQKNVAPKISVMLDIPLVFYGEREAEYGNPLNENEAPTRDPKYYSATNRLDEIFLAGVNAKELMKKYNLNFSDLDAYLPANPYNLQKNKTEVHYLGYYIKWHPQSAYYYSVENTDFMPNDTRTEGSHSKYNSIDDKIDWFHFYTYHAKFGIGRATWDTSQEVRNGDITRDEGVRLIRRFDGEFPKLYLKDCLDYMGITEEQFYNRIDESRPPHLWKKEYGIWKLRKPIWEEK